MSTLIPHVHDERDEFRQSPTWPGYGVYRDGCIRSLKATAKKPYLVQRINNNFHAHVEPFIAGRSRVVAVHRMVGECWVPGKQPGLQIRHLDGNVWNNHADNLAWGTAQQNAADRDRHGNTARGERHGKTRLTEVDVVALRLMAAEAVDYGLIAERFGISRLTVSDVARGRTWKHAPGPITRHRARKGNLRERPEAE